ncbi:hypothetical protein OX283_002295 [Flavobacterium sp. SUN052]|uniref:hypothetical protein n=1 Tax=Flavobacterium sp. SUN052 TaxID=3002441 RepID=UPI00237E12A4|nr:hypothetical protein [Flavobacterium sp. SUN052]MEC4003475.1 hypothetical protein [Flavobacterium sp. SUN052]
MSTNSFNWKSLFINEEDSAKQEVKSNDVSSTINKFPDTTGTFQPNADAGNNNPFLNEVFAVYEKGFESLNQSGFDFFEMYKSVISVGATNPQSYQMAFTMGKTINPELTKAFLLEKSNYYISEIQNVYSKYDATGKAKRKDLGDSILKQKETLTKNISDLESKIAQLQAELSKSKAELEKVDANNSAQFNEFQLKIEANDLAKKKMLDSINVIVTGINQYL